MRGHLSYWSVSHIFQCGDTNIAGIPQGTGKQIDFESPLPSRPLLKPQLEQMPTAESTISTIQWLFRGLCMWNKCFHSLSHTHTHTKRRGFLLITSFVENFSDTGPWTSSRSGLEDGTAKWALDSLVRWAEETVIADAYPLCVLWTNKSLQPLQQPVPRLQKHCISGEIKKKKKAHSKVADLLWRQAQEGFLNFWAPWVTGRACSLCLLTSAENYRLGGLLSQSGIHFSHILVMQGKTCSE